MEIDTAVINTVKGIIKSALLAVQYSDCNPGMISQQLNAAHALLESAQAKEPEKPSRSDLYRDALGLNEKEPVGGDTEVLEAVGWLKLRRRIYEDGNVNHLVRYIDILLRAATQPGVDVGKVRESILDFRGFFEYRLSCAVEDENRQNINLYTEMVLRCNKVLSSLPAADDGRG